MVEAILQYIKNPDGKRIVALTGLYHKYLLLIFSVLNNTNIVLKLTKIGGQIFIDVIY
jgi:hypothetical protein